MISSTQTIASAHFVGIGGAGMSGIALVLHERGCVVTGSDLKASHYVRELKDAGIRVTIGHVASTIDDVSPEAVVVSSAIPETNPEVIRARELGIPVWPRAKMLSYLSHNAKTIAVAGTHGKTTTSSMTATMLDHLGLDPSFLIGGIVEEYKTNGKNGNGGYFVCEADESDGSFLYLRPDIVVITNVEADHLDHYKTMENLENTFCEFMNLVGDAGTIIVCGDNERALTLAHRTQKHVVTYGFSKDCDLVCVQEPSEHTVHNAFEVRLPDGSTEAITLPLSPGKHNVLNASAALAVAFVLGVDTHAAAQTLAAFSGAHRRFTHVGDINGITVVDDYGHHPTEIKATLSAASDLRFKRIVCVFQPHRYSRTQALFDEFTHAFDQVDVLIVCDIFSAGETPIPGVTSERLARAIAEHLPDRTVVYIAKKKDAVSYLCDHLQAGDLLLTQGAGDITSVGPAVIKALKDASTSCDL